MRPYAGSMKGSFRKTFLLRLTQLCGPHACQAQGILRAQNTLNKRAPAFRWTFLPREMRTQKH